MNTKLEVIEFVCMPPRFRKTVSFASEVHMINVLKSLLVYVFEYMLNFPLNSTNSGYLFLNTW